LASDDQGDLRRGLELLPLALEDGLKLKVDMVGLK
jgi:hypothetical protein